MEFPGVFVFGLGISKGSNTILWNIQGLSFVLSGISRGKVKKWKIPGEFSQKNILNPTPFPWPVWIFSEIAHSKVCLRHGAADRLNQNKTNSCSTYHLFNAIFGITTYSFLSFLRLLASKCLPSSSLSPLCTYNLLSRIKFAILQKPCWGNFRKF